MSRPPRLPSITLEIRTCGGPQSNGLQDICRTPDAPINEELEPMIGEGDATFVLEFLDNLDENLDSGPRKIELTSSMVRQDNTCKVLIIRFQGVLPCLHALEDEWNFYVWYSIKLHLRSGRGGDITLRNALEPWNIGPFQARVDESLELHCRQLATHPTRNSL
jgi:hypothetical protein